MPIFTQKKKKLFLTKYYSFLFIHIPRTSGSSVEDYFKKMGYSIKLLDRDYNTNKNKSFLKIFKAIHQESINHQKKILNS